MAEHNSLGRWGEDIAIQYLASKGYVIRETNWRLEHLEIDIVAELDQRIVFVEVKTRRSATNDPIKAIDSAKQNNLLRAANAYAKFTRCRRGIQIDLIAIVGDQHNYTIEHIPDFVRPKLKTYRNYIHSKHSELNKPKHTPK